MRARTVILGSVLVFATACSDRTITEDETQPDRPTEPGVLYAACVTPDDCGELDYCVHPPGEPGFCSLPCVNGDPDSCEPLGTAPTSCVDVGQPNANLCALDCSSNSCPGGMSCQAVATNSGERSLCF